ncbi:MAG TPA: trypsin-like serine protease [Kiloniellales bacterium]
MGAKPAGRRRVAAAGLLLALLAAACSKPAVDNRETTPPAAAVAAVPAHALPSEALTSVVDRNGRMLVEAMEYPWSAIGRVNTGGRGFCSGVLIGPRLVLTSAHCLYDAASGLWWPANEIHFVAGYQRDRSVIHAGIRDYEVAPDFVPGAVNTFANIANNWALLSLDTAIGHAAGWLAIQWQDEATRARLANGDGFLLAAGYRRGWGNAMTVELGCAERACAGSPVEAALPAFVYVDEEFRVLGNPLLRVRATAGGIGLPDFAQVARGDAYWGESRPPVGDVIAAALPRDSIARLLRHLGHLKGPERSADEAILAIAIGDFEAETGRRRSGALSVALLGHLLEAAVRELPRAGLRPQSQVAPGREITTAAASGLF